MAIKQLDRILNYVVIFLRQTFYLLPVFDACTAILIWVTPNQHFKSTLLGRGRGHKKEYAVYASENDDNSGRPQAK